MALTGNIGCFEKLQSLAGRCCESDPYRSWRPKRCQGAISSSAWICNKSTSIKQSGLRGAAGMARGFLARSAAGQTASIFKRFV
jgi:hypothetical protein